jgi:hypothetical protein
MRTAAVILICCVAAACAWQPNSDRQEGKLAVLDAYLIAHGMAESYRESPDADPAVAQELARLDARAAAIRDVAQSGAADTADSERAVAALSDYAASQTAVSR